MRFSLFSISLPILAAAAATETKTIEYGRWTVPSRLEDNGMLQVLKRNTELPCTDCAVTFMQANIEVVGGSDDVWMHHVVLQNKAKIDPVCGGKQWERFFASGNERTAVDFESKDDVGYIFASDDAVHFSGELMNMHDEEREVVLSITYKFVESPGTDFKHVTPYWLDIGGCRGSEKPASNHSYFSYSSPVLESDFHGSIAFVGLHLHDGGDRLELVRNGKVACSSEPKYGEIMGEEHIVEMPHCANAGEVKVGDEWRLTAHYDTYEHMPMVNTDGSLEPIMGIALAYVVKDDAPSKKGVSGWLIFLFVLIGFLVAASVGYVLWNRRRVSLWPRWMSAGQRARQGGFERGSRPDDDLLEDEGDDEGNVWAQQSQGSVRLPDDRR